MVARSSNGRFQPGQSGNARGRPKGRTTREAVRAILSEGGGAALREWVLRALGSDDPKAMDAVVRMLAWLDGPEPPSASDDDAGGPVDLSDVKARLLRGVGFGE